ncbi:spore coat protein [Peribacillus frigoritolerans]|jgi:spore coat protein X|uniref:spore coat protein n=1 Tax=Peribacillus frigoritolerans TaxID=450367 RepID=UPI00070F4B2D|nr:spore coat protein [Peribacillus frigoritolerans]KRF49317.1 spore coat protein [Bacillus sp. Soil745]MBD8138677.1 spore coat protein [Bacillus sp. CFBP 13597]MBT2603816.1 spore coat protein [Bacillus sp. ISL-53]PAW27517.1 spore coat protein [Peribacillus simplex]PRS26652.1 spore coat protein [Bacillus sp. RJGP41]
MNQNVYRSNCNTHDDSERSWSALDSASRHPLSGFCNDDDTRIDQDARQDNNQVQLSEELIYIKDSCNVNITSTDVKAALSLQAALQAAIAVIVSISVADADNADKITQQLIQSSNVKQITRQKTIVENSRDIDITTTDAQIALNIQLLLQLLLALIVEIDIL